MPLSIESSSDPYVSKSCIMPSCWPDKLRLRNSSWVLENIQSCSWGGSLVWVWKFPKAAFMRKLTVLSRQMMLVPGLRHLDGEGTAGGRWHLELLGDVCVSAFHPMPFQTQTRLQVSRISNKVSMSRVRRRCYMLELCLVHPDVRKWGREKRKENFPSGRTVVSTSCTDSQMWRNQNTTQPHRARVRLGPKTP